MMSDDGVGIEVVRLLRRLDLGRGVVILERQVADLSLLIYAREASKLVIVDAVQTGSPPGTLIRFSLNKPQSRLLRMRISHELELQDFAALVRQVGIPFSSVVLVGVEPADCRPGKGLSKPVADAVPRLLREVAKEARDAGEGTAEARGGPDLPRVS